jgi:nicotinamide-nucleotide amidase
MLPEGGNVLPNDNGTAPGVIVEVSSKELSDLGIIIDKNYNSSDIKTLILLPGPPKEMKTMFDRYVRDYLLKRAPMEIRSEYVKLFGIGESQAEKTIRDLIDGQTNPTIAPYCSDGECMFRVSYSMQGTGNKGKDESVTTDIKINGDSSPSSEEHTEGRNEKRSEATRENAKREIDIITQMIASRLGEYVYEIGDRSLPKVVFDLLASKNTTISFAESCTGGMLTSLIADIPGASSILKGSIIAYSNESKVKLLGVSNTAIDAYGAVSEEVAKQMASGCRRVFSSDCAVSVTGIAGPDGGNESKPVGLVYIGISTEDDLRAIRLDLTGDRSRIRYIAALNALDILRREFN